MRPAESLEFFRQRPALELILRTREAAEAIMNAEKPNFTHGQDAGKLLLALWLFVSPWMMNYSEARCRYGKATSPPRLMLPLTLAYDHRVIDGAGGGRFMAFLREKLATPPALTE